MPGFDFLRLVRLARSGASWPKVRRAAARQVFRPPQPRPTGAADSSVPRLRRVFRFAPTGVFIRLLTVLHIVKAESRVEVEAVLPPIALGAAPERETGRIVETSEGKVESPSSSVFHSRS